MAEGSQTRGIPRSVNIGKPWSDPLLIQLLETRLAAPLSACLVARLPFQPAQAATRLLAGRRHMRSSEPGRIRDAILSHPERSGGRSEAVPGLPGRRVASAGAAWRRRFCLPSRTTLPRPFVAPHSCLAFGRSRQRAADQSRGGRLGAAQCRSRRCRTAAACGSSTIASPHKSISPDRRAQPTAHAIDRTVGMPRKISKRPVLLATVAPPRSERFCPSHRWRDASHPG
jgi:hypothetical protein